MGGAVALAALVGVLELGVALADHDGAVPVLLVTAAGWGAGRALRERELVAEELAARVRELEDEREAHAALSVRYERARIASELHDIVAHAISVMVVQASAGQRIARTTRRRRPPRSRRSPAPPARPRHDMGRLVALLGDEDAIGEAPDLALVEELVARAAGSGLDVTLRLEGDRDGLPAPARRDRLPRRPGGPHQRAPLRGGRRRSRQRARRSRRAARRGDQRPRRGPRPRSRASARGTAYEGLRERVTACGGTLDGRADARRRLATRRPPAAARHRGRGLRPAPAASSVRTRESAQVHLGG